MVFKLHYSGFETKEKKKRGDILICDWLGVPRSNGLGGTCLRTWMGTRLHLPPRLWCVTCNSIFPNEYSRSKPSVIILGKQILLLRVRAI